MVSKGIDNIHVNKHASHVRGKTLSSKVVPNNGIQKIMPQNGQRCMHYQSKGEFLLNHKKTEGTYSMLNLVKSPCQSNNWVTSDGYWKGHILFVCTFVVMKNIYIYIYIFMMVIHKISKWLGLSTLTLFQKQMHVNSY